MDCRSFAALALRESLTQGTETRPGCRRVSSGNRPGPTRVVHSRPADAPQLQNVLRPPGGHSPILVSARECLPRRRVPSYQDFLNDDHRGGGDTATRPRRSARKRSCSPPVAGTFTYRDGIRSTEQRRRPRRESCCRALPDADTAFRAHAQTPSRTVIARAFKIALGSSAAILPWPHGAGVSSPVPALPDRARLHGGVGRRGHQDRQVARATATVDPRGRKVDGPRAARRVDPGQGTVRMTDRGRAVSPSAGSYACASAAGIQPPRTLAVSVGGRAQSKRRRSSTSDPRVRRAVSRPSPSCPTLTIDRLGSRRRGGRQVVARERARPTRCASAT